MIFQKCLILEGSGNNGKSVFINTIKALLGKRNVASVSIQDFDMNKFRVAELHGKLANLYADLPQKQIENTGTFKMLIAGDLITAERKYGQPFQFENFAKMIFSANEIPRSADATSAFYRRMIIVTFPYFIDPKKEDPRLESKLTSDEEMSGILNIAVQNLKMLLRREGFQKQYRDVETAEEEYEKKTDPLGYFIANCIRRPVEGDGERTFETHEHVWNAFVDFSTTKKLRKITKTRFNKMMRSNGFKDKEDGKDIRHMVNGKLEYCWENLRLTDFATTDASQTTL